MIKEKITYEAESHEEVADDFLERARALNEKALNSSKGYQKGQYEGGAQAWEEASRIVKGLVIKKKESYHDQ